MTSILVTGGTGTLGRPTVAHLVATGHNVRVLSRQTRPDHASGDRLTEPDWATGDLSTGAGLTAAADGADVIVHLATSLGRRDIQHARNLLAATSGTTHLVVMSIVGIDQIPVAYYRHKLTVEHLIADSGMPYTIQRATQFHNLLDRIFTVQRFLPALVAPAVPVQPIAVDDVAARLTDLVDQAPVNGRASDIGGPEQFSLPDLARAWRTARRSRRPVAPLRLPGKIFRAYASGSALVDGTPYGHTTFEDYLGAKA